MTVIKINPTGDWSTDTPISNRITFNITLVEITFLVDYILSKLYFKEDHTFK